MNANERPPVRLRTAKTLALIAAAFLTGAYAEWILYPRAESYLYQNDYARLWREIGGHNKSWAVSIIGDSDGGKARGMEAFYRISIPACLADWNPYHDDQSAAIPDHPNYPPPSAE